MRHSARFRYTTIVSFLSGTAIRVQRLVDLYHLVQSNLSIPPAVRIFDNSVVVISDGRAVRIELAWMLGWPERACFWDR